VLSFLGAYAWWYTTQGTPAVPVVSDSSSKSLSLGWPADVAPKNQPKASISDFSIDTTNNNVASTSSTNTASGSGLAIVTSQKPSVSSFSVNELKPVVVADACVLPTILKSCCDYSGINRNECISSIALSQNQIALCDYITGTVAKAACKSAFTTVKNTTTNQFPVAVSDPGITTNTDISPTTYVTDASNGGGSYNWWTPTIPTSTYNYSYPTSTYNPTNNGGLTVDDFNNRMSQQAPEIHSVGGIVSGGFLARPGEFVIVQGTGFSTSSGNILHFKEAEPLLNKEYQTKAVKSSNGSLFYAQIPFNIPLTIYKIWVTVEGKTQSSESTGNEKRMTIIL